LLFHDSPVSAVLLRRRQNVKLEPQAAPTPFCESKYSPPQLQRRAVVGHRTRSR
jgi:hypothetical protein